MIFLKEELSGEINKNICERSLVSKTVVGGTRFFYNLRSKERQND